MYCFNKAIPSFQAPDMLVIPETFVKFYTCFLPDNLVSFLNADILLYAVYWTITVIFLLHSTVGGPIDVELLLLSLICGTEKQSEINNCLAIVKQINSLVPRCF